MDNANKYISNEGFDRFIKEYQMNYGKEKRSHESPSRAINRLCESNEKSIFHVYKDNCCATQTKIFFISAMLNTCLFCQENRNKYETKYRFFEHMSVIHKVYLKITKHNIENIFPK